MYEKELQVLTSLTYNWSLVQFQKLIKERAKFEENQGDIRSFFEKIYVQLKQILPKARDLAADENFTIHNIDRVVACVSSIKEWNSNYQSIVQNNPDNKYALSVSRLDEMKNAYEFFNQYLEATEFLKEANRCNQQYLSLGKPTEDNFRNFDSFITYYSGLNKSVLIYLPIEIAKSIEIVRDFSKKTKVIDDFYKEIEDLLHQFNDMKNRLQQDDCKYYINNANRLREEYEKIAKSNTLKYLGVYKEKYEHELLKMIGFAQEQLKTLIKKDKKLKSRRITLKTFSLTSMIVFFLAVAAVIVFTVIEVVQQFNVGLPLFFAILFGIIVGILYAVIRISSFFAFGAFWWPGSVSKLMNFGNITIFNLSWGQFLNVAFIALFFLMMIWNSIEKLAVEKKRLFRKCLYNDRLNFVTACFCCIWAFIALGFLSGMVYLTLVETLTGASGFAAVIAAIVGFFVGIFRFIMLIAGGGFWWQKFYIDIEAGAMLLNCLFYGGLVMSIVSITAAVKTMY